VYLGTEIVVLGSRILVLGPEFIAVGTDISKWANGHQEMKVSAKSGSLDLENGKGNKSRSWTPELCFRVPESLFGAPESLFWVPNPLLWVQTSQNRQMVTRKMKVLAKLGSLDFENGKGNKSCSSTPKLCFWVPKSLVWAPESLFWVPNSLLWVQTSQNGQMVTRKMKVSAKLGSLDFENGTAMNHVPGHRNCVFGY